VAPVSSDEVSHLLKGYSGSVMIVGSGTSFLPEFNPGPDTLIILGNLLKEEFEITAADQVMTVSAGWSVAFVNEKLKESGFIVPALAGFDTGTIGGRMSAVSSRPSLEGSEGWIQALLGLTVVLPSGEILELGSRCIKDVAGYNMCHFFTGSRGAVGIIVSAIFRCRPFLPGRLDIPVRQTNEQECASLLAETEASFSTPFHEAEISDLPVATGKYNPKWRRVFDPFSRMKPGY